MGMVDEVARALCEAAGRTGCDANQMKHECVMCDPEKGCTLWPSFRYEAQAVIIAAYKWNKRERRWPSFVK
jgi:hypothetical protein